MTFFDLFGDDNDEDFVTEIFSTSKEKDEVSSMEEKTSFLKVE